MIGTFVAAAEVYTNVLGYTRQSVGPVDRMLECLYSLSANSDAASKACGQELMNIELYTPYYAASNINKCIGTVALTVNVVIGDSVVWWRAWVLWPGSWAIRSVCIIMMLLTSIMGIMDTHDACDTSAARYYYHETLTFGTLFSNDLWGVVTALSSLLTNIIATTFIAYRAWEHRRTIMSYLRRSSRRTQVERTLALLVESGLLYCALWVLIVTYELGSMFVWYTTTTFENGFYYVMEGCIVLLIGMYPTLIIILCAVDKSIHEKSADDHAWNASLVFYRSPSTPRGTLSELLSATSATVVEEDVTASSADAGESQGRST
ncbi:hypothetical protein C8T65DRAFT_745924 [Cerioporus squamosus]|nr:hypothetical protein C8T65DRAFT_745924 [Cerioporus squamosus]